MMMKEILLATNNDHKRREFTRLLPGMRIVTPQELGIDFSFEEDGDTFLAYALGKARALFLRARRPVLADDSGLCVAALGGEPGIHSARYGAGPDGRPLSTPRRNALLLEKMNGTSVRVAYFVCCCVLVLDEARFLTAQETVHGQIADAPRGDNGFGYDPLFLFPERGLTMAQLEDGEKDAVSHRGRAARRILALLRANGEGV
jgi:XTP/dITP diphosphohydrolase